eukprot:gnl/MRDRNA2_/MRDRNA2_120020_c0_seq1.p1 gnl/MRDRNA2_/MRDRNA2_120020_c0~~gnl/MRDRNA2_/MRDRNA2_120020_c0_seq1.p1  ORF type:complete len:283 (-),score=54.17 gnl/MRDRNA2_/MRDRNA2_120020_c0_seq1:132-920(-)
MDLLDAQAAAAAAFFERPPQSLVVDSVCSSSSRFAWLDYVPSEPGDSNADGWFLGPMAGRGRMPWQMDSPKALDTWRRYYAAMESLVADLMRVFALALDLPSDTFDAALKGHRSPLRAVLYPEVSECDFEDATDGLVVRAGEHSDWGCVTVLRADPNVGGLEIATRNGGWEALPAVPGGLVVNLGDLLPRWTSGQWVATPHRVVARKANRGKRLSVPYFGLVNRQTVISPLVSKENTGEDSENFEVMTAGEFFDNHEKHVSR